MEQIFVKELLQNNFPQFDEALRLFLLEIASVQKLKEGEIFLKKGEYIKHTMLVLKGLVKIYREDEEGNNYFIYALEKGNACALSMLCISRQRKSVMIAKAESDALLLKIPIQYTDQLMQQYPQWYRFVIENYSTRFEELLHSFDEVVFKKMDKRLYTYLQKQFEKNKTNVLTLTHQAIAHDLNSSREVISRLLKKMEQQGIVLLHRKQIEWLDTGRL